MHTGKVRGKTRSTLDELTGGFSSVEGVRSKNSEARCQSD